MISLATASDFCQMFTEIPLLEFLSPRNRRNHRIPGNHFHFPSCPVVLLKFSVFHWKWIVIFIIYTWLNIEWVQWVQGDKIVIFFPSKVLLCEKLVGFAPGKNLKFVSSFGKYTSEFVCRPHENILYVCLHICESVQLRGLVSSASF